MASDHPIAATLAMAPSRLCSHCKPEYEVKECLRLAVEQPTRDETLDRHDAAEDSGRGRNRADDGTSRELSAKEGARLRHDQIIEKKLPDRGLGKVRKSEPIGGVGQG